MTYPNQQQPPQQPYGYGPPTQPLPPQPPPPQGGNRMHPGVIAAIIFGAIVLLAILGTIVGSGDDNPSSSASDSPLVETASSAPAEEPTTQPAVETAALPNLVGKGLQEAQDAAQAAGFYLLKSHDLTGQDRYQVWDRNWQVCTQTPGAGKRLITTKVDFGVVKVDETCP